MIGERGILLFRECVSDEIIRKTKSKGRREYTALRRRSVREGIPSKFAPSPLSLRPGSSRGERAKMLGDHPIPHPRIQFLPACLHEACHAKIAAQLY